MKRYTIDTKAHVQSQWHNKLVLLRIVWFLCGVFLILFSPVIAMFTRGEDFISCVVAGWETITDSFAKFIKE